MPRRRHADLPAAPPPAETYDLVGVLGRLGLTGLDPRQPIDAELWPEGAPRWVRDLWNAEARTRINAYHLHHELLTAYGGRCECCLTLEQPEHPDTTLGVSLPDGLTYPQLRRQGWPREVIAPIPQRHPRQPAGDLVPVRLLCYWCRRSIATHADALCAHERFRLRHAEAQRRIRARAEAELTDAARPVDPATLHPPRQRRPDRTH